MLTENTSALDTPSMYDVNTRMMLIQTHYHIPRGQPTCRAEDPVGLYVYYSAARDTSILRGSIPSSLFVTTHSGLLDSAAELEDCFGMLPIHPDDPRFYAGLDS